MQGVSQVARFLPNLDRISVLSAMILLAYSLTGLIHIPSRQFAAQLPGFYLEFELNIQTIVSLLVTILAVSGTNWLIQEHPSTQKKLPFEHWLIPALTAWVIGIPLYQGALGPYWWLGILLGGGALILVLADEYIVIDPQNPYYSLASIGLVAVGHALFFLLSVTLRAAQLRLFLIVPALTIAITLISFRTLKLKLKNQPVLRIVSVCAVILPELTIVAHYLPLSPIAFGLFLLGPAYGLTSFLGKLASGNFQQSATIEALVIIFLFWISAWCFH